jgi:hypothetical protein
LGIKENRKTEIKRQKANGKRQRAKGRHLIQEIQKGRSFPNPTFALFNLPFAF